MKYRESQTDKKLRKWFSDDFENSHLRLINLTEGKFRGLTSLDIKFDFPITAMAVKNGAGKSTILALAACAYHNSKNGFKLPKRKNSYYTFSDFFIQHSEEISPSGIAVWYQFAHNNWKITDDNPESAKKLGYQVRRKKQGGKWNDYDTRIKRNVIFLGIERIVPHSERSQSRSYSKIFKGKQLKGWESKVKDAVGFVLNKSYETFSSLEHEKYSLPLVTVGNSRYSGFNMGAGENALFEIFSIIYSCGTGALLILDEVELGLHADAQRRFINKLKDVCFETKTQVICTTHSREIFDCLPSDARFFLEKITNKSLLIQGISSDFAFAKLADRPGTELDVFVEDEVAKSILMCALPNSIRSRISIKCIGSASAISRQMAAHYVRDASQPVLAVFDGDQRTQEKHNLKTAANAYEVQVNSFNQWVIEKIDYLPSNFSPEKWLLDKAKDCIVHLAISLDCDADILTEIIASQAHTEMHDTFYEISRRLGLDSTLCLQTIAKGVVTTFPDEFRPLIERFNSALAATA
jgi:predicted ATPase